MPTWCWQLIEALGAIAGVVIVGAAVTIIIQAIVVRIATMGRG